MVATADGTGDAGQRERRMTVARVRERADHAAVTFYESARFYRLPRTSANYAAALRDLRAAAATGIPVQVRLLDPDSDIIEAVNPKV